MVVMEDSIWSKMSFKTNTLNIIFWLFQFNYDHKDIGPSSVVYIFHKCIISEVLCGYVVQMNM